MLKNNLNYYNNDRFKLFKRKYRTTDKVSSN